LIEIKYCKRCDSAKTLAEFNLRTVKGEKKPFSYCKDCEKEYNNNRYSHTCSICNKDYKSGKKKATYCKDCFSRDIVHTYSILHTIDKTGENNGMYGVSRYGKDNPNYNYNLTDEQREVKRYTQEYKNWRLAVYEKDNFTCQTCNDSTGGNLEAHHLNGFNWDIANRYNVDNGITLCTTCHKDFHDAYGYGNNTKEQFISK